MSEDEWRGLGVQMSQGWKNYMRHGPGKSRFCLLAHEKNMLVSFVKGRTLSSKKETSGLQVVVV